MADRRSWGSGSLIVRTDSAGRETWHAKWRHEGWQYMRRIGPRSEITERQAERRLRELMAEGEPSPVVRGATVLTSGLTIGEVHERYLADRGRKLKATTLTDYRSIARNELVPRFGQRPISTLSSDEIGDFIDCLLDRGLAPKSARNYATYLFTLLKWAVERGWLVRNPATGVTLPEDPDKIDELRFLTVVQVHDLINAAQPGTCERIDRALYTVSAMAGLRYGECIALRWRTVDFAASQIRVLASFTHGRLSTPKSRSGRPVPMAPDVAAQLAELAETSRWNRPDDLVLADPACGRELARTQTIGRYKDALKAAGIGAFRFHDLRHTFGTQAASNGVPVTKIQEWMGHASLATTQRYMHYAPAHDDAAMLGRAFALADPRSGSAATNLSEPQEALAA